MGIHLADQTLFFFQAALTGMLLALLFDAFRISRIALPTPGFVVFVEDLLYWLFAALVTFAMLLRTTEGVVRVFLLIGAVLGAVLYTCTVGVLVMSVSKTIIRIVKGILLFFYRVLIRPVYRLVYWIVSLLLRPVFFLMGKGKKTFQKCRFRLKVQRIVVYNHCKALFAGNGKKKRKTKKRNAGEHRGHEKAGEKGAQTESA